MNIHTTLQIGEFHTNHCEDFLIVEDVADNEKLLAVFDGCSSGKESVFASILFGKLLRNISKKEFHKDFIIKQKVDLKTKLEAILEQFFKVLKTVKFYLDLDIYELLSTIILCVVDTRTKKAEIIVVGDGLVSIDGTLYDFENNDKPDYLAYHLQKPFQEWFNNQQQKISVSNFKDLSIATDGIFAFKNLKNKRLQKPENEIIDFLLHKEMTNTLTGKIKVLKQQYDHMPTDDIAIIRLQNETHE